MEIKERVDCLKIPLKEGDLVGFSSASNADITTGVIMGFSPKKIRIKWNHKGIKNITKFSHQVISVQANKEIYPEYFL